jgi:hypothetical protein
MKVARLSALRTGRWINLNDHIGNPTRDIPAFSAVPQTNCATAYPKLLPHTCITISSCMTKTYFAPPSVDIEPRTRIRWSYAHDRLLFHNARYKSTVKPRWAYPYFASPVTNDFYRWMYLVLRWPIGCGNANLVSTFDTRLTRPFLKNNTLLKQF